MPNSHSIPHHHLSTPPHRLSPPPISDRLTQRARREAGGRGGAGSLERRMRILCVIKSEPWRERGGMGGACFGNQVLRQGFRGTTRRCKRDICKTRPRGSAALPQVGAMRSDVPRRGRRGSFAGRAVYPLFRRPAPGAVRVQRGPRREGMSRTGRGTTGPSAPGVPPRGRAPPRRAAPGHGQPCPEGHRNVPPRPMP